MSKPIGLFAADTHLIERSWSSRQITGDSYYSFTQLIDAAISLRVPLFILGDVLDHAVNGSSPIVFFNQQMERMKLAGVPVWIIQGQHEYQDTPWLHTHPWPKHMHGKSVRIGVFDLYGLDYQPSGKLQEALSTIPVGTNILCAHQVWAEFAGEVCAPQGSFGDVPGVSVVFTGDLHKTKKLVTRGKSGQTLTAYSPGSISMNAIDEPAIKNYLVLHDDGGVSAVPLKTRPMIDWFVMNTSEDLDKFVSDFDKALLVVQDKAVGLPSEIAVPLLRVTYSYRLTDAVQRVRHVVAGRAHLFFKELSPEPEQAVQVTAVTGLATMEAFLPDYLKSRELAYLQDDCSRLLAAEDVAAELQRMRAEALTV
jgi:hypothetical protein